MSEPKIGLCLAVKFECLASWFGWGKLCTVSGDSGLQFPPLVVGSGTRLGEFDIF